MLADDNLERGKSTHNTRLRIDHTYPEQELYVLSLYTLFSSLITQEPFVNVRKADLRTGKEYKSISVKTLAFPCLNKYQDPPAMQAADQWWLQIYNIYWLLEG